MKKSKKLIAGILSIVMAGTLLLTGCSTAASNANQAPQGDSSTNGSVTLDFWYAVGGRNGEGVQKLIKDFNDSHPNIVVKATYQGDYYANATKLQAALVSGNQPDVVMLEIAQVGQFGNSGALADLGQTFSKEEIGKYQEGLMKNSFVNNKLVAIPFNRSTPILYVNKTMLKNAGLDPAGPKNWDELREYAKRLSNKEKDIYGFETPIDIWFYEAGVFQQGGKIFSDDEKQVAFKDEAGYGIVKLWQDMVKEGSMKTPPGQDYNAWDVSTNDFVNQKVAMIQVSTATLGGLLKSAEGKFELGTAFLPAGKQFGVPTGGANLAVLQKSSEAEKKAAAEFIKWLTNKENAAFFSEWSGYMPVTQEAVESDKIKALYDKYPQYKTALDQLKHAQARPMIKGYREMQVKIQDELKKAMIDTTITPEQAVNSAAQQVQDLLNKSK